MKSLKLGFGAAVRELARRDAATEAIPKGWITSDDIARRYNVNRLKVQIVLRRMREEGIVEWKTTSHNMRRCYIYKDDGAKTIPSMRRMDLRNRSRGGV